MNRSNNKQQIELEKVAINNALPLEPSVIIDLMLTQLLFV